MRREFGWPLAELGNVRLRRGDLAGAEAAFLEAHRHVWTPHPGLALVRLAQGDLAAADAIQHPFDAPSKERPPFGDLRLAPLYDAQAAIAATTGDAAVARGAANALDRIASRYPSRGLRASAALADSRVVAFDGTVVVLRDLKGFRHIERLLARPGRELHVLQLVAAEEGAPPPTPGSRADDGLTTGGRGGLAVLDDEALAAYRRRLAEVEEDVDEARQMNDPARQALAERDREYLVAEITRAVGLGGRHRTTSDATERARTAVARSIRCSLSRLDDHLPALSDHLARHIRTGGFCSYEPDPTSPLTWEL
jgi:hypothetical protein